jgi:hypothetical protein
MPTDKLDVSLAQELVALKEEGRAKPAERIIEKYIPPKKEKGPRYKMKGSDNEFIRMNSNSYLSLSNHAKLMSEADKATQEFGRLKMFLLWLHAFEEPFYSHKDFHLLAHPTLFKDAQTRFVGVMFCLILNK